MKKAIRFVNLNYPIFGLVFLLILAITLSSCSGCSGCALKKMSNEDYIKIYVRTNGQCALFVKRNPAPHGANFITIMTQIEKEVCAKYGYSQSELQTKRDEVKDDLALLWVRRNSSALENLVYRRIPETDQEWEEFFNSYQHFLHE